MKQMMSVARMHAHESRYREHELCGLYRDEIEYGSRSCHEHVYQSVACRLTNVEASEWLINRVVEIVGINDNVGAHICYTELDTTRIDYDLVSSRIGLGLSSLECIIVLP